MVPIYSTTCGVKVVDDVCEATVIQRFFDEDSAQCPLKGGCKRCRVEAEWRLEEVDPRWCR